MLMPKDSISRIYTADGPEFKYHMTEYIRWHFSELLGDDVKLLDEPGGLEKISKKYLTQLQESATR